MPVPAEPVEANVLLDPLFNWLRPFGKLTAIGILAQSRATTVSPSPG
jgi:hypothetical protein